MKEETKKKLYKFRDERNWKQFHNGEDLAISLVLETSEFLEIFQWNGVEKDTNKIDKVKEELADVFNYAYLIADCYRVNIDKILKDREIDKHLIMCNPKSMAISMSLFSSDLLGNYNSLGSDLMKLNNLDNIVNCICYVIAQANKLAEYYKLDIDEIVCNKIKANALKYPVEKAMNNNAKYNEY